VTSAIVRRGRIKVDARRAVAKLRDHLLLDPDTWPLEVVRAAVLGGATRVHVAHDADDLVLSFDGEPPAADAVARLLDYALESSRDERTRSLRLLAIAVNASLSASASRVDVAVRDADGAVVARFAPGLVRGGEASEPTGRPEVRRAPVAVLRGGSASIAAHKGFGWGTFVRFATGRVLREAELLASATRHAPVPVTITPPIPDAPARPVLRLDLEPHGVAGGVLDVVETGGASARLLFLELGVLLAEVPLGGSDAVATSGAGVHLPVVARVDARRWRTNASRSKVHERDARRVCEEIVRALPAAARALARGAGLAPAESDEVPGVLVAPPTRQAAERALSAFACCAAASEDGGPLDHVLDLPLVRDAVDRPMTPRQLAALVRRAADSAGAERVFVHRGAAPLPAELGPFAREVPWLRGHPIERLLDAVHVRDFSEVHDDVARGLRRREAWLALPARPPHVPAGAGELFRVGFEETDGDAAGLTGEIVVHLRRDRPLLRVFVEGRPFSTLQPPTFLPLDAAITWPGRLRADMAHEALVADGSAEIAGVAVIDRASRELAARADRLAAHDAPEEARALARAALAASDEARRGPLRTAAVWPTASGAPTSLAAIDEASACGAIAFVQRRPAQAASAADGRLVLVLRGAEAACLGDALGRAVDLVPYGPALLPSHERAARVARAHRAIITRELEAQDQARAIVAPFAGSGVRGLVATAAEGVLVRTHAGIELSRTPLPISAPAIVVVEEAAIVPTAGWDGVRAPDAPDVGPMLDRLVASIARIAAGDDDAALAAGLVSLAPEVGAASASDARAWALAALAAARRGRKKALPFADPLAQVPIATMLDDDGQPVLATLAAIRERRSRGPIPYLLEPPDFPTLRWRPLLVARRDEVATLAAAIGLRLHDAEAELPKRREEARAEHARREVLGRPPEELVGPVPGAPDDAPTALHGEHLGKGRGRRRGKGKGDMRALVALAPRGGGRCTIRWCGHAVGELRMDGLPPGIAAIVDTADTAHLERWVTLSLAGRGAASQAIVEASRALATSLVTASDDLELATSPLGSQGALALVAALVRGHPALETAVRLSSVRLPGALGDAITLARATQGDGPIVVARERFDPALAEHVVDAPVLIEPDGGALADLLAALGPALHDVTGALRRIAAPGDERVGLDGAPVHPALRAPLAELGVTELVGELELTAGSRSTVRVVLHDGAIRSPSVALPFAVRVAARPARLDARGRVLRDAGAAVERAAHALLERIAPVADDLPLLARAAIRAAVVASCARGERPSAPLVEARVFGDVTSRATSLGALLERTRTRVTRSGPPYPESAHHDPPVVPLAADEIEALRKLGAALADVTAELDADAEAEARARAPRVEAALDPATRRRCLAVDAWSEAHRQGELGVLRGGEREAAGITVLLDHRPLCTLKPPRGWPVAAVWNDDRLEPSRRRDGLAPASQAEAIVEEVATRRQDVMRSLLRAPPRDALASLVVEASPPGLCVLARLWLVDEDEEAELHLRWGGAKAEERLVRLASNAAAAGYPAALPVGGDAFVVPDVRFAAADASHEAALGRVALDALPALLDAIDGGAEPRLRWHAALLGAGSQPPPARDAAGGTRPAPQVLRELRRRGVLWTTRRAGVSFGELPSDAPAFVLLDDDASPLLDLLEDRAPGLVRELGGLARAAPERSPVSDAAPPAASGASDGSLGEPRRRRRKKRKPRRHAEPAPPARSVPAAAPSAPISPAEAAASSEPSWLARVGAGVKELFAGPAPIALADGHPIGRAVADAARRLGVEPAPRVVAVPRGRPVRFDADERTVEVVLDHPAIDALLAARELEVIGAAALAAMNHALHEVTDAEELRALADLLEARAGRA
jgi:hypothetical protein